MLPKTKPRASHLPIQIGIAILFIWAFRHIGLLGEATRQALSVCLSSLVPSLFPFFILSDLLSKTKEGQALLSLLARPFSLLLGVSPRGAGAYLGGLLLGFPMGVKQIAEGYADGSISKEEAERLLLYANNTGPAFAVGCIGGLLGSIQTGVLLYGIQLTVSLFFGILLHLFTKKRAVSSQKDTVSLPQNRFSLVESIPAAAKNMLSVCGFVLFFSALSALLFPLFIHPYIKALVLSIFEIGSASAFITGSLSLLRPSFCAFAICFSGISVYFQGKEIWQGAGLSAPWYLPFKLLQGLLAFLLTLPLSV